MVIEYAVPLLSLAKSSLSIYNTLQKKPQDDQAIRPTLEQALGHLVALQKDLEDAYLKIADKMKASNVYVDWVKSVNKLVEEAKDLLKKHEKNHGMEKVIRTINPFSKLNKEMKKKTIGALFYIEKVLAIAGVRKPPECVKRMENLPNIEGYKQLKSALAFILEHVTENVNECKGVRIYGILGVGKTTIMKILNNHPVVATKFDLVIWVTVSKHHGEDLSKEDIQNGIAERLGIDLEDKKNLAERIKGELKDKKFLLLLDGVNNDYLNIEEIGICSSSERQLKGSKIVLTCPNSRQCDELVSKSVEIKRLDPEEARKMFVEKLGDSNSFPNMQDVIDYCSGIPYLLEKLALAFKSYRNDDDCAMGMERLLSFSKSGDKNIARVDSHVHFFCDKLMGIERDCFLYSALYPPETDIDAKCLFDCWTAEDLVTDNVYAYETLQNLTMGTYLEETPDRKFVTMEKHIWRVARAKLQDDRDRKHLVEVGKSRIKDKDWDGKVRISLVNNDLLKITLPECPDSPHLSSLFLQNVPNIVEIKPAFFTKMGKLLVLNFQNTGVRSIPISSSRLQDLKVFFLNNCIDMEKFPEIADLGSLEVLDIRGSRVNTEELTQVETWAHFLKIESLTRLRRLLVSFRASNDEIVIGDIKSFCSLISTIHETLEDLVIDVNSPKILHNTLINMVRDTVISMENLKFLTFIFRDGTAEVIKMMGRNKKFYFQEARDVTNIGIHLLESFEVYVGCSIKDRTRDINQHKRYLKFDDSKGRIDATDDTVVKVLSSCDAFELVDADCEHLTEIGSTCFNTIVGCIIEGCDKMTTIAYGDIIDDNNHMLPMLEMLCVKELPELKSLWEGMWQEGNMVNLKTLNIENCSGIKELLNDYGIWKDLKNLKKLVLVNLPLLETITSNSTLVEWPALEEIQIDQCPLLKSLPFNNYNSMKLKFIKASRTWWEDLDHKFRQDFHGAFVRL